jgi:hypothetical protein
MAIKNDYAPGQCNIGIAEIRRRRRGGWAAAGLFVVATAALAIGGAAPIWYLLLFIPALAAAVGFLQAAFRFCVYFGFSAIFNFAEIGQTARVVDPDARRRDRGQAAKVLALSAVVAALVALAAYAIAAAAA